MKILLLKLSLIMLFAAPRAGRSQWIQTNGPYEGQVTAFATMGTIIFAGTGEYNLPGIADVFRSKDSGRSWQVTEKGLYITNVGAMAVIGATLFAATDSGVFKSIDSGESWRKANTGLRYDVPTSFASIGTELFAVNNGVFLSTNFGTNWTDITSNFPQHVIAGAITTCGTNIFAETGNGVYRSTDSGSSWFPATAGLPIEDLGPLVAMGTNLFASAGGYVGHVNVYRSTDFGASWTLTGLTGAAVDHFAVIGTVLFAAGTIGGQFYRSTDSGTSWSSGNDGLGYLDALVSSGTDLIAGTTGKGTNPGGDGVYISSDSGMTWIFSSKSIENCFVSSLASDGSNLFAGTNSSGVLLSADDGANWTSSSIGLGDNSIPSLLVFGTDVFASVSDDSVYLSKDSGKTFFPASNGIPNSGYGSPALAFLGSDLFAGTYYGIYRSTDSGRIWTAVGSGLPKYPDIFSIVVSDRNLFATSYDNAGVLLSTDSGGSWHSVNQGLPNLFVESLTANGSNLFVTTVNKGVFRSTDSGSTWTAQNSGLPDSNVGDFGVYGANTFILSDSGVYLTTDNGASWHPVNQGLRNDSTIVSSLQVAGKNLFIGTWGAGVWRRPLSEMIGTNAVAPTPLHSHTLTAYPNPSTQSATISFTAAESGEAEITIVNLLGEEVARLFEGTLEAGAHTFTWDGRGMPPGVYECVARLGGSVERVRVLHLP